MGHAALRRGVAALEAALGARAPKQARADLRLPEGLRRELELVRGHGRQDVRSHGRAVARFGPSDSDAQPPEAVGAEGGDGALEPVVAAGAPWLLPPVLK